MRSLVKAADISDADFVAAVAAIQRDKGMWANTSEVQDRLGADIPVKVVLAKARRLIRRGVITGCACGCRGDFEVAEGAVARVGRMK